MNSDNYKNETLFEVLKDNITPNDVKEYVNQFYANMTSDNFAPGKKSMRSLTSEKKKELFSIAERKKISSSRFLPSVLNKIPDVKPLSDEKFLGIKSLDERSQNLKLNLDGFEQMSSQLTDKLLTLESTVIDCQQLSGLSRVLSDSSLQELDQIHKLHGSNTLFKSITNILKSLLPKKS